MQRGEPGHIGTNLRGVFSRRIATHKVQQESFDGSHLIILHIVHANEVTVFIENQNIHNAYIYIIYVYYLCIMIIMMPRQVRGG